MSEKTSKKKNLRNGIIAGLVLIIALVAGYATGNQALVLDIFLAVGLILLAITILVSVHEMGHFLAARMFGIRVETFSIGFPPKIFGVKRGDTEYQIGATPLGGYVKISGMIDESMDTNYLESEPKPYEFRSKPVWQRLIVMLGGVTMNVILGILIFSTSKYIYGDQFLPMEAVNQYGIEVLPNSVGDTLGFQTGDRPLTCNGEPLPHFQDYLDLTPIQNEGSYTVLRDGKEVEIPIPSDAINLFADEKLGKFLFLPDVPSVIRIDSSSEVLREGPAYQAGLRDGDRIIMLDSVPIRLFSDLRSYVGRAPSDTLQVVYERNGAQAQTQVVLKRDSASGKKLMYVGKLRWQEFYKDQLVVEKYNFFQAFGPGTKLAFSIVSSQAKGLARLPEPGVKTNQLIQGPIEITKVFLERFKEGGWGDFLRLTGILSMILALMNILPIPALDGGHVMFLLYEMITRREPSTKVKLIAQQIGLVIVLGLMAYLILNGVFKQF
jgi:regulator of sigma E protease